MKNIIKIRIVLWAVLGAVVVWLLYMGVVPSGQIAYVKDFSDDNYFIKKLTPEERVKDMIDGGQKIIGDPVYFALRTPRRFSKVMLELKYRNESELPVIEAGVLVDKTVWRYNLQPIENRIIDQLALVWDVTRKDSVMLLQKEKKFNSIDEFLNNLPDREEMALYNYDLKTEYVLPSYASSSEERVINYALRGSFEFYTYIKGEVLDFTFNFADLNQNKDHDPIDLYLYYDNQLLTSRHLDDNDLAIDNGEVSDRGEIKIKLGSLPEGVYKIELKVNDDIVTKKIITKQSKLAFINKVWLVNGDKNISLYSDSNVLQAKIINPGSLQTIKAKEKELAISETYKQFSLKVATGTYEIKIDKGDIILAGDGVFSFSPDDLFNPQFKKVTLGFDINQEGINYVLARYNIPKTEEEWKIAQAEFDLTRAYREFKKYNIILAIPGLRVDDDIKDFIEVDEIKMELEGTILLEKINKMIK
jgi:hypothetical protein